MTVARSIALFVLAAVVFLACVLFGGDRTWVLRRPPLGHVLPTAHDMAREYRVLAAITSRPGEVVRRRTVVAAAWPDGAIVSENTVDSFIRRVRAKLEAVASPVVVETVRGVGFRVR